jgi:hypothetical protein
MATYNAIKYNVDYGGFAGSLIPIATFTSDGSDSNATFTSGIDSTYDKYLFIINNIHPQTDNTTFGFNGSADSGSNYNVTKTTTFFRATQEENDSSAALSYETGKDIAQGTGDQQLAQSLSADNDGNVSGKLWLFNPSSTTFVKHFIATVNETHGGDISINTHVAGYFNTTSAVDAVRFQMASGEIQGGTIQMFGVH